METKEIKSIYIFCESIQLFCFLEKGVKIIKYQTYQMTHVQSDDLIWTLFIEEAVAVLSKWSMDHEISHSFDLQSGRKLLLNQ